jgi:hypothetical protein
VRVPPSLANTCNIFSCIFFFAACPSGEAMGLSFSVPPGVRVPPSLGNMYKELAADLGCKTPNHGCLEKVRIDMLQWCYVLCSGSSTCVVVTSLPAAILQLAWPNVKQAGPDAKIHASSRPGLQTTLLSCLLASPSCSGAVRACCC